MHFTLCRQIGYHYYFAYDDPLIGVGAAVSAVFRDILKPLVDAAVEESRGTNRTRPGPTLSRAPHGVLPTTVPRDRVICLRELIARARSMVVNGTSTGYAGKFGVEWGTPMC